MICFLTYILLDLMNISVEDGKINHAKRSCILFFLSMFLWIILVSFITKYGLEHSIPGGTLTLWILFFVDICTISYFYEDFDEKTFKQCMYSPALACLS